MFENTDPDTVQVDLCLFFNELRQKGQQEGVFAFHDEAVIDGQMIHLIIAEINASPRLERVEFVHPSHVLDFFLAALHPQIRSDVTVVRISPPFFTTRSLT